MISTLSRVVSAWFAFLLPCYATFKALSRRPLSEADLQKWSMYWTVIGAFMAFEYLAEWLISWLPFYWELKTVFLLFLSLPQTEGSTYIYNAYLQPFFSRNEADLDAGIVRIQGNILAFAQEKVALLWNYLWSLLTGNHTQSQTPSSTPGPTNSQFGWLVSPDMWRSALNVLQPTLATTSPSIRTTQPQDSIGLPEQPSQQAPSFPVPQHYA